MHVLPSNTPKLLRSRGLKVVVVPGWRNRKTNSWQNGFGPVGVLCHHTATSIAATLAAVLRLLTAGRVDLSGPLCNFGLGRDGTVYLVAGSRANHAGTAKASGSVASGDGNFLYYGIEAFNDGVGESYPAAQYDAYVLLCAVLCVDFTGNSAQTVRGHKETSYTGKIDPTFDMDNFRRHVAAKMVELQKPDRSEKKQGNGRGKRINSALKNLRAAKKDAKGPKAQRIQAAIAATKLVKPAKVNKTH